MKRNYRKLFAKKSLRFRRWGHKSYSAFCSIGRHVTIGHVSKGIADASLEKSGAVDEAFVERIIRQGGLDREEAGDMSESVPLPQLVAMASICETAALLRRECGISLCLSAGLLDKSALVRLHGSGISRYHCNLETAPSYFGKLCSTHTQAEKIKTLSSAREAGMDICSGGIIGMGETMAQRLELAFTLKELGVKSVPMNILSPIKGTPLAELQLISEEEILKTVALYRLVMPDAYLRFAGGRARLSEQALMTSFQAGINSAIIGDMLTTTGADVATDKARILAAGYML